MKKILITGSAGFIGMHTVCKFIKNGFDVVGIDNISNYYDINLKYDRLKYIDNFSLKFKGKWNFINGDLSKTKIWTKLKTLNIEKIIHLAAQPGVRYSIINPSSYLKSNIVVFQNVLDFCNRCNINDLFYASSSSVYGKNSKKPFKENESCNMPESYYAVTKKTNELMARSYFATKGISSIGLRFFTVYGPWGRPDMAPMIFTKNLFNKKQITVYNFGNQTRDFTYIDDIVDGIYLLSKKMWSVESSYCQVLNIGKGSPDKLMDFINILEKNIGLKFIKKFEEAQVGDVTDTYASLDEIQNIVDYKPKVNLNTGIKNFINWYKKYYKL